MATQTTHYNLTKPDAEDYYDIGDFNKNTDSLDQALFTLEQEQVGIGDKIGANDDTTATTVMGKLNHLAQPTGKETFYVASNTTREALLNKEMTITGFKVNVGSNPSDSLVVATIKTPFCAEKNGVVRIKDHVRVQEEIIQSPYSSNPVYIGIGCFPDLAVKISTDGRDMYSISPRRLNCINRPDGCILMNTNGISTATCNYFLAGINIATIFQSSLQKAKYTTIEDTFYVRKGSFLEFVLYGGSDGISISSGNFINTYTISCDHVELCYDEGESLC